MYTYNSILTYEMLRKYSVSTYKMSYTHNILTYNISLHRYITNIAYKQDIAFINDITHMPD